MSFPLSFIPSFFHFSFLCVLTVNEENREDTHKEERKKRLGRDWLSLEKSFGEDSQVISLPLVSHSFLRGFHKVPTAASKGNDGREEPFSLISSLYVLTYEFLTRQDMR